MGLPARLTATALTLFAVTVAGATAGCKDSAKESSAHATEHVTTLAALTDKDVGEVSRGLPDGATRLVPLFANNEDPRQNFPSVRKELQRIRRDVPDLLVAKSTFFALADNKGIAIRNDLEQDVMAGQNLVQIFPALSGVTAGNYVTTTGAFPGGPGPAGPDKDWIAAAPIKSNANVVGMLVTGWTYRAFARHLQESLERDVKTKLMDEKSNNKMPIIYVAVFDASGAYAAPHTPQVNEKALTDLNLGNLTKNGDAQGTITITDRAFGYAAKRTPSLAPDMGVAVLRSEI